MEDFQFLPESARSDIKVSAALSQAAALGLAPLDAQLLLLHALGKHASDRAWVLAHDLDTLQKSVINAFNALVQRRLQGEPVAYLIGRKEFFGLDLFVDQRVLVPRPDTETLVEWALAVLDSLAARAVTGDGLAEVDSRLAGANNRLAEVDSRLAEVDDGPAVLDDGPAVGSSSPAALLFALDLGTGSGAVALAIKHSRPAVQMHATDFSAAALAVAQGNANRLNLDVQFSQGTWLNGLRDLRNLPDSHPHYHLIVSNPPYIAAGDLHLAALAHEPLQALTSGADGLDDIRAIISQAPSNLQGGGWLLLEHGYDQAARVRALLQHAGFDAVQSRRDLGDIERCSGGRWTGPHISP